MRRTTTLFIVTALMLPLAVLSAQALNDAQIAAIVVTANQVDVDAGKVAESSASDPQVKAFGTQMVTDHTGVNKQASDLVTKLGVTPEDNATAQSLKAGGAENVKTLSGLKGAAFDRAYIEHEIAYHQQVLDALEKDTDSRRDECRAQGAAREGPAGVRGPSRAREDGAEVAEVAAMHYHCPHEIRAAHRDLLGAVL
jgi:putative membrane protein